MVTKKKGGDLKAFYGVLGVTAVIAVGALWWSSRGGGTGGAATGPVAIPQIGEDIGHLMQGKVVIDLTNPRADRDGPLTDEWLEMGTGLAMAQYLPGARLVKAFNSLGARMLANPIGRSGEKIGVPIAGDDAEARDIVADLVRDTGLEPVMVGRLERAKEFDRGSPVWVSGQSAAQLREALNLR